MSNCISTMFRFECNSKMKSLRLFTVKLRHAKTLFLSELFSALSPTSKNPQIIPELGVYAVCFILYKTISIHFSSAIGEQGTYAIISEKMHVSHSDDICMFLILSYL